MRESVWDCGGESDRSQEVAPDCIMELKRPVKMKRTGLSVQRVIRKEHGKGLAFVLCIGNFADLAVINSE